MKKVEKNELRRLRAVQLLLKRHASVYAGYTGLERAYEKLSTLVGELDAVQELQIKGSTSVTEERNQYRIALEELMANAFSHLLQVADDLHVDGLRLFATVTDRQLQKFKAEEISAKGNLLLTELERYEVSLEETGFYLDDRGVFSDALTLFKDWMQAPRETIDSRKVGTTLVPELLKDGRRLVRRQMQGFMRRYKTSNRTFYMEFLEAKKLKRVAVNPEESEDDVAAAA